MNHDTRQALVELLLLALYLDNHLSLLEDSVLEDALKAIGWSATNPEDVSITAAFATAREAGSCEMKTEEFLQQRASLLKGTGEATLAYNWLGRILGSDGISGAESRFLNRAKTLLFE